MKLVTVKGLVSDRSMDLPDKVVKRFAGKKDELRMMVDAWEPFFHDFELDPTTEMAVVAQLLTAKWAERAAKGAPDVRVTAAAEHVKTLVDDGMKQSDAIRQAILWQAQHGITVTEIAVRQKVHRDKRKI